MRPAKTDQPAHMCNLIRVFADRMCLLQPRAIQRGINENPCHTGWMYRLVCVFAGFTDLIVGFVVHWLNGVVGWCEGAVYLTSPGCPADIGLQLGKACYSCSR